MSTSVSLSESSWDLLHSELLGFVGEKIIQPIVLTVLNIVFGLGVCGQYLGLASGANDEAKP